MLPDKTVRMREKLSYSWVVACFGIDRARSRKERSMRVLEEAIELAQACGHKRADCLTQLDQTFAKPTGEIKQEIGGVLVTLASLCGLFNLDMDEIFTTEFARCIEKMEAIRVKGLAKSVIFASVDPEDEDA